MECVNNGLHKTFVHIRQNFAVFCGNTNVSALAEHALSCGHEIDWENANILDHSDLFYPRLYLESWYIQKQNGLINREVGILPNVYKGLM